MLYVRNKSQSSCLVPEEHGLGSWTEVYSPALSAAVSQRDSVSSVFHTRQMIPPPTVSPRTHAAQHTSEASVPCAATALCKHRLLPPFSLLTGFSPWLCQLRKCHWCTGRYRRDGEAPMTFCHGMLGNGAWQRAPRSPQYGRAAEDWVSRKHGYVNN